MLRCLANAHKAHLLPALLGKAVLQPECGRYHFNPQSSRSLFAKALQALTGKKDLPKGDRQLFDVKWHDEYATLGDDNVETHRQMVAEDARLRSSRLFHNPLRREVFDEIVQYRKLFTVVRCGTSLCCPR
jgi:hypothetical protein